MSALEEMRDVVVRMLRVAMVVALRRAEDRLRQEAGHE
jgi:hypothetical protein